MAVYNNYNNTYNPVYNSIYGGNNYQYGYSNGNYSTQTNIVNGVAYQKNITTLGGGCGGDNTCADGYSIYVPCIKNNITRGQNVCFDFFIGDNANQEPVDMRDLDALSIDLTGRFNCPLGSYTYPDDIESLQEEKYAEIYSNEFSDKKICHLYLEYKDEDFKDVKPNVTGSYGEFYYDSLIELHADDTPTHIFVGWMTTENINDDECDDFSYKDMIVSNNKDYSFYIKEDKMIYVLYRERKSYKIKTSFENRHSYFEIKTNCGCGCRHILTDKERDFFEILEGYHFVATCIPNKITLSNNDMYEGYTYNFINWSDDYQMQSREMIADDSNIYLSKNNEIRLLANCSKQVNMDNDYNFINDICPTKDIFEYNYPTEHFISKEIEETFFFTDDDIIEIDNISQIYEGCKGYLKLNKGYIRLRSFDIDDGMKISIVAKPLSECNLTVIVNGFELSYPLTEINEFKLYDFYFRHCENSDIVIKSDCKLYIDDLTIYREDIINKGKARLCVPSEDTEDWHTGQIMMSGAIGIGGNVYGLDQTLIGNINNLKSISVL